MNERENNIFDFLLALIPFISQVNVCLSLLRLMLEYQR